MPELHTHTSLHDSARFTIENVIKSDHIHVWISFQIFTATFNDV